MRDVTVATQRFDVRDWIFLFGAYLLNGIVYLGMRADRLGAAAVLGAVARVPRLRRRAGRPSS